MAGTTLQWPLAFDPSQVIVTGGGTVAPEGASSIPNLRARSDLPRRGVDIPVGVNKRGSTRTVTSDDNDRKIISTALSDNANEHAYQQDPGLGASFIFDVNDEAVRGLIIQRLRDVFADFQRENRYRLIEESASWTQDGGVLILAFDYLNIESDEPKHFTGTLRGAQSSG